MICTLEYLTEKYKEINENCFDGQLPKTIGFRLIGGKKYVGRIKIMRLLGGSHYIIEINKNIDFTQIDLDSTIAHEMIHLHIDKNRLGAWNENPHGKTFLALADKLNKKYGFEIEVKSKFGKTKSVAKQLKNVFITFDPTTKQYRASVAPNTRVGEYRKFFTADTFTKQYIGFAQTTHPAVQLLASGTRFIYYMDITKETAEEILGCKIAA